MTTPVRHRDDPPAIFIRLARVEVFEVGRGLELRTAQRKVTLHALAGLLQSNRGAVPLDDVTVQRRLDVDVAHGGDPGMSA